MVRDEDIFFKGHRIAHRRRARVSEKDRVLAFEYFVREALVKKILRREFAFIDQNEQVRLNLEKYFAVTKNEKYNLTNQKLLDWYVVRLSGFGFSPISRFELKNILEQKGLNCLAMKIEDFIDEQEIIQLKKLYPEEIYLKGKKYQVRYYSNHYHYPNGPAISISFEELKDLSEKDLAGLIKENPNFKPYILICSGDDFINPTAEGYQLAELKNDYDLWFLKKEWKTKRREMEVRGIRGAEIYPYFNQVLKQVFVGSSLFVHEGEISMIYAYTGLKAEGKKYLFTLFDTEEKARSSIIDVLKRVFLERVKYNFYFKESEQLLLDQKGLNGDEVVKEIWKELDFDDLIKEINEQNIKEYLKLKEKKLAAIKSKLLD
jgi:hypothetical protein